VPWYQPLLCLKQKTNRCSTLAIWSWMPLFE
jgi:hypothetical protein